MRESIGSTWIFGLVMIFTLIFAGFLVLAISYSKTYRLKNEMTSIIEKYEGPTTYNNKNSSIDIINKYLINSNYSTTGSCPTSNNNLGYYANSYTAYYGVKNLNEPELIKVTETNNKDFYYCIAYKTKANSYGCDTTFMITLFYDFNLPVFGHLRQYSISGQTNTISNAYFQKEIIKCKQGK